MKKYKTDEYPIMGRVLVHVYARDTSTVIDWPYGLGVGSPEPALHYTGPGHKTRALAFIWDQVRAEVFDN